MPEAKPKNKMGRLILEGELPGLLVQLKWRDMCVKSVKNDSQICLAKQCCSADNSLKE